jgi:histidine triad (HIT) family protein
VASIDEVDKRTPAEQGAMLGFIVGVARQAGLVESGYRVVTNHGPDSRQSVFHLHWHVLGGARLSESM